MLRATYHLPPVSCLALSAILKMEAIYSSKTSVVFQGIQWRFIPNGNAVKQIFALKKEVIS
jgi:hypothetical protein